MLIYEILPRKMLFSGKQHKFLFWKFIGKSFQFWTYLCGHNWIYIRFGYLISRKSTIFLPIQQFFFKYAGVGSEGEGEERVFVCLFVNVVVAVSKRFNFLDISYLVTKSSLSRKPFLWIDEENVWSPQNRSLS